MKYLILLTTMISSYSYSVPYINPINFSQPNSSFDRMKDVSLELFSLLVPLIIIILVVLLIKKLINK